MSDDLTWRQRRRINRVYGIGSERRLFVVIALAIYALGVVVGLAVGLSSFLFPRCP